MKPIKIEPGVNYAKISTYYKTNWPVVIAFTISGLLFDGLMSFIPKYLGILINMASLGEAINSIIYAGLGFIGLVLFIQLNRFFKRYFVRVFCNHMTYVMRKVSFNFIIHSPLNELNIHTKGDILNRNLSDINDSSEGIRKITTEFFDTFVLLIGYAISLFTIDWKLTLISTGFIVVSLALAQLVGKLVYFAVKDYKKYLSNTKDTTLIYLKNETYYRGLGVVSFYNSKYKKEQDKLENLADKSLLLKSSLQPIYQCVVWLNLAFVIYLGGKRLFSGDSSFLIGDFSAYLSTYMLVAAKTAKTGKLANAYQGLKVSWERCKIYLKHVPEKTEASKVSDSGLIVEDLTFGFTKAETISNASFSIKPGEIVGLCGRVHSGKSTILQAINGLYDYKGSVKLGGVETRLIRSQSQDNQIGFCSSFTQIFSDTIENNISLGKEGSLEEAIYIADLEEDLNKKESGEKEYLYRSVENLSGGQAKRLMIARAVFNNPKLIILDNPFESIEEEMSLEILRRLRLKEGKSSILITSNQENILRSCDRLAFIDNGTITFDTYQNLLSNKDFVSFLGDTLK